MTTCRFIDLMGYRVFGSDINSIGLSDSKGVINTLNAYSYVMGQKDYQFKEALMNSDILLADGFPIVLAARFLQHNKIQKIAGEDIFLFLCKKIHKDQGKCFFLGSTDSTLDKIKLRLKNEYPGILAEFYSPPFAEVFEIEENNLIIDTINRFSPDVLFIGMTAPKQEKWVHQHKERINAKIICSVGAVFDFYAQTVKRPSKIWIHLHLEWIVRLIKEPRRLWKRYLLYSPLFFLYMIKFKVKKVHTISKMKF